MDVTIVDFPEVKVAALEHRGAPHLEHETIRRLVEWRMESGLAPGQGRSFGVHYNDPRRIAPADYRVDFCIEVQDNVAPNRHGVVTKHIPGGPCAMVRHLGSRANVSAAFYLYDVWLPRSGERLREFPIFFHYVNVGLQVREDEMITDVYLPLVAPG
jgi:AraC family transcriptional regulator